jgi:hypothetical protein
MTHFVWKLQRLLDVTVQREQGKRQELAELARRMAELTRLVETLREGMRRMVAQLSDQPFPERLGRQEICWRQSVVVERQIAAMTKQKMELELRKAETMAAFLKLRASRQTLERLREEARQRHQRKLAAWEQRQLDESYQISYARQALAARA